MLTTLLKCIDTIVTFATTSSSIIISVTGIWLVALAKSAATASGLSIGNKVIYGIVMQNYNKDKKQ